MADSDWLNTIDTAVIAALNADASLVALCGLIEVGLMLPLKVQDIPAGIVPYIGGKSVGYGEMLPGVPGGAVRSSVHDVTWRADVQHMYGQQRDAEARVRSILSQIAVTIGRARGPNPFSVNTTRVQTIDLFPGSGMISMVSQEQEDMWIVEGEYVFKIRVKLFHG